jgi:hypothetical protein
VAIAGFDSGTMIREYMYNSLAPSTRAASERDSGIVIKNCLTKKVLNTELPKKVGIIRGL